MGRVAVLGLAMLLTVAWLVPAERVGPKGVSAALVQVQDCLELNGARLSRMQPGQSGADSSFTLRALGTTLAIGVLSILFCAPAALAAEYLSRRGPMRRSES